MKNYQKYMEILGYICQGQEPGKKMVQKLMYLIERKGVNLNLNYSIHFYGPYSATLDDALHSLEAQGLINITIDGLTHKITLTDAGTIPKVLSDEEKKKVLDVIGSFNKKSPSELEALTTLDYISHTMLKDQGSIGQVVDEVLKIKSKKFTQKYLMEEYEILKQFSYVD